ncbi:hypothetical protein C7212DRAFT_364646 [Tuber magnatum]|uniref:HTH psq-type domain-containing protein n=1 Tax=Tuber magnatum TaxID=42249 RepID=A0A317SLI9_9PEZI|nr:hypothetical protein C7212DRAFT_364646 [Tuber magnatum]
MPVIKRQKKNQAEESIQRAINYYWHGDEPSIRAAAEKHEVVYSTLWGRLQGRVSWEVEHLKLHALTEYEENFIIRWLLKDYFNKFQNDFNASPETGIHTQKYSKYLGGVRDYSLQSAPGPWSGEAKGEEGYTCLELEYLSRFPYPENSPGFEEKGYRQYHQLMTKEKQAKTSDRRKLTQATVVTFKTVIELQDQ